MFDTLFFDRALLDLCIEHEHNLWVVTLSYLIAAFASYTAFHLVERVKSAAAQAVARRVWLLVSGVTMGAGIWAMHFVAMLAVVMPVEVRYDITITAASAGVAMLASGLAFHFVASERCR